MEGDVDPPNLVEITEGGKLKRNCVRHVVGRGGGGVVTGKGDVS